MGAIDRKYFGGLTNLTFSSVNLCLSQILEYRHP